MTSPVESGTPRTPAPVEVGVIPHNMEQQVAWYREALSYGAVEPDGTIKVYGVFIAGSDTPICYTGNGPTSEANAYFIAECFNNYERQLAEKQAEVEQQRKLIGELDDGIDWHKAALTAERQRAERAVLRLVKLECACPYSYSEAYGVQLMGPVCDRCAAVHLLSGGDLPDAALAARPEEGKP